MSFDNLEGFREHPAYQYAYGVSNGDIIANKDIKIVCDKFIQDIEHPEDNDYFFDFKFADKITEMTKLIKMPSGVAAGKLARTELKGFQWFFFMNALVWKMKSDHEKRRYEKSVLLIGRKNGKTFLTAIIFILLLLLEPKYSNLFSVAPDLELSSLIKDMMGQLIDSSPALRKHFEILKSEIRCKPTKSVFKPLATSNNRMDGRLANVFCADEVGALASSYPIQAMVSSQMGITNRTGILISTAYPTLNNPMTKEIDVAEKIIRGEEDIKTEFALLYRPDNPKEWATSDEELFKANPLAIEIPENKDFLIEQRHLAIISPEERSNFLTKHMNIFINGDEVEQYVSEEDLVKCEVDDGSIDWNGREVYVGLDLSQSDDNTAVSMSSYDFSDNTLYAKSWAFYPKMKESEKTRFEKVDYARMTEKGYSFACGDTVVDYNAIEDFVLSLENTYGVKIKGIGYDKWNAAATVQRLSNYGYQVIEVRQNAFGLYEGTKLLKEQILQTKFAYEENDLLKENFLNARMVVNAQLAYYLNKKQSDGKIDMVAALCNSTVLWNQDIVDGNSTIMSYVI